MKHWLIGIICTYTDLAILNLAHVIGEEQGGRCHCEAWVWQTGAEGWHTMGLWSTRREVS